MMKRILLLVALTMGCSLSTQAQSNDRIAFGGKLICQLDDLNAVDCVTNDSYRRLLPPSDTPPLTSISAGDVHVCGITQTGGTFCWGDNDFGQLNAPQDVQFTRLDSGDLLTCGITTDNNAVCWGLNSHGAAEPPADKRFTQIALDTNTSCGLELDGTVTCWGQYPDRADRLAAYTFSSIDINGNSAVLCGVTDQNDVRCHFSGNDILGNMVDVAQSSNLTCGLSSAGDITCRTNLISASWDAHLAARIAEINSGPNVATLYSDKGSRAFTQNQLCYELDTGEFGCIVRENATAPVLPGDQSIGPDTAQNVNVLVYSNTTVELVWDSRFDIAGADIYRNNELLAVTNNGSSYLDDTLVAGVQYEYSIAVFDVDGVRSELSAPFSVTSTNTSGYTPANRPFEPTGITVINYNQNEIELIWDRITVITNNFSGYEIWRDHEFIAFTRGVSFYDNSVQPDSVYDYDVVAVSEDGTILGFNGIEVDTRAN